MRNFIKELMGNLKFIFKPDYWTMNYNYCPYVDQLLIDLIDNNKFEEVSRCEAKIGGATLWTENHPYASFTFMDISIGNKRASRKTIHRAGIKLKQEAVLNFNRLEVDEYRRKLNIKSL